ncbi:MAG: hypothetical protein AAFV88_00290 [Planctomycetota bacterium]
MLKELPKPIHFQATQTTEISAGGKTSFQSQVGGDASKLARERRENAQQARQMD